MRVLWCGFLLSAFYCCLLTAVLAQETSLAQRLSFPRTPVLVLDWDRLFADSRVGRFVLGGLAVQRAELAAENARIQEQLAAEELELAERRPTLDTDEFQALASEFDQKVQRIRADQDTKEIELQRRVAITRQNFRRAVEESLITAIMRERGAVLVLDRNLTQIYSNEIDITEEVIARMGAFFDTSLRQGVQPDTSGEAPPTVE